jgi:CHAD domain-containing protein
MNETANGALAAAGIGLELVSAVRAAEEEIRGVRVVPSEDRVHDTRVSLRRLRVILELVLAIGVPEKQVERLTRMAKRLFRKTQELRETEVEIGILEGLTAADIAHPRGEALVRRRVELDDLRTAVRNAAKRFRIGRFLRRAERLLFKTLALGVQRLDGAPSLASILSTWVDSRRAELAEAIRIAETGPSPAAYHAIRILGKRLRYGLTAVATVLLGSAGRGEDGTEASIQLLKDLQDRLGELNDVEILSEKVAVEVPDPEILVATLGRLAEERRLLAERSLRAWMQRDDLPTTPPDAAKVEESPSEEAVPASPERGTT